MSLSWEWLDVCGGGEEKDVGVQSSSSRRSWMERGAEISLSCIFYHLILQMKIKRQLWKESNMDSDYCDKCLSL